MPVISPLLRILFYQPTFNLLILIYNNLASFGIAILLVALIARLVLVPLTRKQIRSAEKNQSFQKKVGDLKKKYKNDQDKLTKEMAKAQAEFLPGQAVGCLNIIISILLLFQVRSVLINLINRGAHAFNEVAYVESMKMPEDTVTLDLPDDYEYGVYKLDYHIVASDGQELNKKVVFGIAENETQEEEFEEQISEINDSISDEEKERENKQLRNFGFYIPELDKDTVIIGKPSEIKAYLRAPSRESIDYSQLKVWYEDNYISDERIGYTEGISLNLTFLGADLSKVATDFDFRDISTVAPYVIIAVLVAITQMLASKIQTGLAGTEQDKEKKEKSNKLKKKGEPEEQPDFSEMMQQSSKQMMYIFPIMTALMSLGFIGGANLFPSGVSLFWTGQNGFVIIQQSLMKRKDLQKSISKKFGKGKGGTVKEGFKEKKAPEIIEGEVKDKPVKPKSKKKKGKKKKNKKR